MSEALLFVDNPFGSAFVDGGKNILLDFFFDLLRRRLIPAERGPDDAVDRMHQTRDGQNGDAIKQQRPDGDGDDPLGRIVRQRVGNSDGTKDGCDPGQHNGDEILQRFTPSEQPQLVLDADKDEQIRQQPACRGDEDQVVGLIQRSLQPSCFFCRLKFRGEA